MLLTPFVWLILAFTYFQLTFSIFCECFLQFTLALKQKQIAYIFSDIVEYSCIHKNGQKSLQACSDSANFEPQTVS